MKQTMRLNVSQRLTMTPALQQAIRMLQLSTLDLKAEIRDTLESNFMLEAEESTAVETGTADGDDNKDLANSDNADAIPNSLPLDAHWNDIYTNDSATGTASHGHDTDWQDYRQNNLTETPSLHAHLSWQADMHPFSEQQRHAASHIIDAIDDNGFVQDWADLSRQITHELDLTADDAEQVLAAIHGFDPAGVGARSLSECLAIQLHQISCSTPGHKLALRLVEDNYLNDLVRQPPDALARRLDVPRQQLDAAHALLKTLQPHPGNDYIQAAAEYIIPEVFAVRHQGRWLVQINPDIAPRLRINSDYLGLIKNTGNSEDRGKLKANLQEARTFLHNLRSRNQTLQQVAQCIVEAQHAFLDYGDEAMKPLVLHDVSDKLDIHESTVSRATANKYIQTPRGIFELKHFFSSHVATADGGQASATAIRAMIKRIIAAEQPARPVSDSKLTTILLDTVGVRVARRTVAKYREELGIASSHRRKRKSP